MPIVASESSGSRRDRPPAPAMMQQCVCVDVIDMGIVEEEWGGKKRKKHIIYIVWHSIEKQDNGEPYEILKRYTLSLGERATLRAHLEAWRGREFTEEERRGFDVETVIGVNAFITVKHTKRKGRTWADIVAIQKVPKEFPKGHPIELLPITPGYVRACDRGEGGPDDAGYPGDDDVPF